MGEDPSSSLEDLARAAAVFVEYDRLGDVVVPAEANQHVRVRAGPCEDRLLVVTDREDIAVRRGEALEQVVLHVVHVLEFIDEHVVPAVCDPVGEWLRLHDEIVEVHHVAMGEPARVFREEPRVVGGQPVALKAVPAEEVEQLPAPIGRHSQPAQDDTLIRVIGHAEALPQARGLGVFTQECQTKGVNGAARDCFGLGAEGVLEPGRDLARCTVGECNGTDPVRIESAGDEMLDPRDEAIGLARPGARDDEDWAEWRFDCETLLGEGLHP